MSNNIRYILLALDNQPILVKIMEQIPDKSTPQCIYENIYQAILIEIWQFSRKNKKSRDSNFLQNRPGARDGNPIYDTLSMIPYLWYPIYDATAMKIYLLLDGRCPIYELCKDMKLIYRADLALFRVNFVQPKKNDCPKYLEFSETYKKKLLGK